MGYAVESQDREPMEPPLTLHKLRVFREVVARQSLTLAAQELFVSQPVVSAHVRDLEQYFGARLLRQEGRRMLLNEAGRAVYEYAVEVLRATEDTRSIVRLLESAEAGAVAVGSTETTGTYLLPSRLTYFKRRHPRAAITLGSGSAFEIWEDTKHGLYDFSIVAGAPPPSDLHVEVFSREAMAVVANPSHPLTALRRIRKSDLRAYSFVSLARRPPTDDRLQELGLTDPTISMRLGNVEGLKEAVAAGLGLAVLFRLSAKSEVDAGTLVELHIEGVRMTRPFYLIYSMRKRFSPLQLRLLDSLNATVGTWTPPALGEVALAPVDGTRA
jgi:DNA-binding transcriptional LysR family regulator